MVRAVPAEQSWGMDNASPSTEQPGPGTPPPSGPRVTRDEMKDLGRLRRSVTDRHVAGVAGGIARHLDVDPIIVRVALVVAAFFGGAGLLLYVAAWILVPEEGTADEPLGLDQRSRTIALAGVGVLALLAALGDWAGAFWFPWPLAIVVGDRRVVPPPQGAATPRAATATTAPQPPSVRRRSSCRTPAPGRRAGLRGPSSPHLRPRPAPGAGYRRQRSYGSSAPRRAAQPAQPRTDPVLAHDGADLRWPMASSAWSTSPASRRRQRLPRAGARDHRDDADRRLVLGPRRRTDPPGVHRRARHRRRDHQRQLRGAGPLLRADQRCRRPTGLRVRRRSLHPRPVRRLRRRGARRPRHHDRRGRRTRRGGRPRRDGRRRPAPRSSAATARSSTSAATASTSRRTGSSTAATTSRTCPSPSTWSAARSSSAKRPEEHCHD